MSMNKDVGERVELGPMSPDLELAMSKLSKILTKLGHKNASDSISAHLQSLPGLPPGYNITHSSHNGQEPRTVVCVHRGMEHIHKNSYDKDDAFRNTSVSQSTIYIYIGVFALFILISYVIKSIVSSRRKLRTPRPRLVIGEITEISQAELAATHSNHQSLLSRAQEYRINSNPLYDSGRNLEWPNVPRPIAILRGRREDTCPRNSSSCTTPSSSYTSNCQTIRNPLFTIDNARQNEHSRITRPDCPPSYSEIDTLAVEIAELESPPPSYYEAASVNLKRNM